MRRMTAMRTWMEDELAFAINHQKEIEAQIANINPTGRALALWNYRLNQAKTLVNMAQRERDALDTLSVHSSVMMRECVLQYLTEELDRRRRNAASNLPNH